MGRAEKTLWTARIDGNGEGHAGQSFRLACPSGKVTGGLKPPGYSKTVLRTGLQRCAHICAFWGTCWFMRGLKGSAGTILFRAPHRLQPPIHHLHPHIFLPLLPNDALRDVPRR